MIPLPAIALALLALVAVAPGTAAGQAGPPEPARLVADSVRRDGEGRLVAEGAVEIRFEGYRLMARAVSYDPDADTLSLTGPMRIVTGDGTTFLADSATLSRDLSDGLIRSARLVLNRELQLAAGEAARVDGRYTVLDRAVASSCRVCADGGAPLWRIRAARVVHDTEEQRLRFSHPRFEVAGVPVGYLPSLELPGPGVERARGFLVPELKATNRFGTGLKLPYFIPLGRSADLTLTPYLARDTRTLELRYRQAFRRGDLTLEGAASEDPTPGGLRGYLFAVGGFALARGFDLSFSVETVSDDAYLSDYGISQTDRLESTVTVSRTRRDAHLSAGLSHFETLRAGESNDTQPTEIAEAAAFRRADAPGLGGTLTGEIDVLAFARASDRDVVGRDVARLTGRGGWTRRWPLAAGASLTTRAELAADYYAIGDDSAAAATRTRLTPALSAGLRWPLIRPLAGGGQETLEPIAQLAWSTSTDADIPNEDSRSAELDEGNLFSLTRFSGEDARETGLRANLGGRWTHRSNGGWWAGLTAGRVLRAGDEGQFTAGSGLNGTLSDWLVAGQVSPSAGLVLTNRGLIGDDLDVSGAELRLDWSRPGLDIASSYLWQSRSRAEGLSEPTSEWLVDGSYDVTRSWTARGGWRYDFTADGPVEAELGLGFRNECVEIDLSLSRDFTRSASVRPITDIGLSVRLIGFGSTGAEGRGQSRCVR